MLEKKVKLNYNESLYKINDDTMEVKEIKDKPNNIPEGKQIFEPKAVFRKDYTKSWKYLQDKLTPLEMSAAMALALMAKANTNSLEPINDETGVRELSEKINVSVNKVTPVLIKLFELGVYAKFTVAQIDSPYKKFWILNPYLSFSGKLINSDIARLFKGTKIEVHFHTPDKI